MYMGMNVCVYRRLNRDGELMLHYFEAQATALAEASGNLTDYFKCLAKLVEAHRAKQKALDDQVRVAGGTSLHAQSFCLCLLTRNCSLLVYV